MSEPQVWHDSLQNPEIMIVLNCGFVSVFSSNRVRLTNGGHREDKTRENVMFSLNAFDLLDYAHFLETNGYAYKRMGLEARIWQREAQP